MKLIYLFIALSAILSGCAYKGDVYINSPQGEGNVIDKNISTQADIDIPLIP